VSEILPSRFEILELLGSGALGVVYKARDRESGRVVAVKRLKQDASNDVTHARFEREFQAMERIRHANVVKVHELGLFRDCPYFTMEYIPGGDLRWWIAETRPRAGEAGFAFYCRQLAYVFFQVAAGLDAVHGEGVIHRDLKPENIVLKRNRFPIAKLLDFGHARDDDEFDLTATGTVLGTAWYLSPEIANGRPPLPQSDLYSMGCVLYEALTLRPPYVGASVAQVLLGHLQPEIPDPRTHESRVPDVMAEMCLRLMAKDVSARPQTARQVAEAFAAL
jgi:serine/threonine-protein kinase